MCTGVDKHSEGLSIWPQEGSAGLAAKTSGCAVEMQCNLLLLYMAQGESAVGQVAVNTVHTVSSMEWENT